MPPGSDVGTMTMLGYDPARYHTGRAPIEAASQGIELGPDDVVFRMNLVSLQAGADGALMMDDFTSGHITSEEAARDRQRISVPRIEPATESRFFNGVSYRHLMVWRNGLPAPGYAAPRYHRQIRRITSARGGGRRSPERDDAPGALTFCATIR